MGSSKPKKIKSALIVNPYWESLGGGERYTASFAKYLLDKGWKVDICTNSHIQNKITTQFGIDITAANTVNDDVYTAKYDLCFWVSDGSLPVSFAKKTLIHFQFPFTNIHGRSLKNRLKSKLYTYIVNSMFTKSFIDKEFNVKSYVVYPPIDTDHFLPQTKTKTILYVGRFSDLLQKKNHLLLIQAFLEIEKKLPSWKLVLAGGVGIGTDQDYLDQIKTEAKKSKNIHLALNPSFKEIQELYAKAQIFWSATGYGVAEDKEPVKVEHFGMSVVEAMAAGCIPIVIKLGGYKEIITDKSDGFLVNSIEEMKKTTCEIVSQSNQRQIMSKKAIQKSEQFSIRSFYKSLESLI